MLAWGAVSITRHYGLRIVEVTGLLGPCKAGLLVDRIMARTGPSGRHPAAGDDAGRLSGAGHRVLPGAAGPPANELHGFAISLCGLTSASTGGTSGPLMAWLGSRVFRGPGAMADGLSLTLLVAMLAGTALFVAAARRAAWVAPASAELSFTQAALRG